MKSSPVAAVLLLLGLGCSNSSPAPFAKSAASPPSKEQSPASQRLGADAVPRKIIYTGGIDLLVGDLSEAASRLDDLVRKNHGLVAESEISGNPRAPRSGNWRVRIPVDRFTDFVHQVAKLGESIKNKTDSQDITDKYFDFQVRIENKKVQVERLQRIIKKQTGQISDLLEAERELGRVTTELEQLKGTVKLWENQAALATVNISMRERTRYVAPEAPSFVKRISRTFWSSLETLIAFAETLVLIVVAFSPWLPVTALVVFPLWLVHRRTQQRAAVSRRATPSAGAAP